MMQSPRLDRCRFSAGAAILAAALAAASLCSNAARAQDASVKIANFTFAPKRLTVKAGTTVTWGNDDDIPHTIASAAGLFKSMALEHRRQFLLHLHAARQLRIFLLFAPAHDG